MPVTRSFATPHQDVLTKAASPSVYMSGFQTGRASFTAHFAQPSGFEPGPPAHHHRERPSDASGSEPESAARGRRPHPLGSPQTKAGAPRPARASCRVTRGGAPDEG